MKQKQKGSSFHRFFRFTIVVIISFLVVLGIIIISLSSNFYKRSRLNDIRSMGELYLHCISEEYDLHRDGCLEYAQVLRRKIMGKYDVRIYIYDKDGKELLGEEWSDDEASPLSESMKKKLDSDDYLEVTDSTALSTSKPYLTYGTKHFLLQENGKYVPIYVVISGSTDDLNRFTLKMILSYAAVALLIIIVCYFIFKRRIGSYIKFEEDFLRISEKYTKGKFDETLATDLSPNLKQIAEHVNTLAENVSKSEEISTTFIANVSHELRTPMTTIGGFVDGILDGTIKKSRQQEYLILVSQEIQRLRILITSMLNMSKFESGTMIPNFQETNLTELVIKVVLMFEKRIEEKNLEVEELDSSRLTAIVDADLMQQVIYNLVENAVKFVNEGGTLSFRFDKKDDICIIGIKNTGEGLTDDEIPRVFIRFYKTDSSRGKDKTGLGLGLSISRKIVHLHNGHIVVKSVHGEYTEFQIQIPVDPRKVAKKKKEN